VFPTPLPEDGNIQFPKHVPYCSVEYWTMDDVENSLTPLHGMKTADHRDIATICYGVLGDARILCSFSPIAKICEAIHIT
jgi:hypothetical protein